VRYLVVGGYAVAYYGYPRTTGDIDIWIDRSNDNAERIVNALRAFGFDVPGLQASTFTEQDKIVRMGYPPLRAEILTSISGVEFSRCFRQRVTVSWSGVAVPVIGLEDLKINKAASGRLKDLSDLEHLP
jgi:hypothetical protein